MVVDGEIKEEVGDDDCDGRAAQIEERMGRARDTVGSWYRIAIVL